MDQGHPHEGLHTRLGDHDLPLRQEQHQVAVLREGERNVSVLQTQLKTGLDAIFLPAMSS